MSLIGAQDSTPELVGTLMPDATLTYKQQTNDLPQSDGSPKTPEDVERYWESMGRLKSDIVVDSSPSSAHVLNKILEFTQKSGPEGSKTLSAEEVAALAREIDSLRDMLGTPLGGAFLRIEELVGRYPVAMQAWADQLAERIQAVLDG